jgi:rhodanese-related sulfurtransferase
MRKILALFSLLAVAAVRAEVPKISPADAAQLVSRGSAVLVDVREPAEWAETGVVTGAVLLPKSDFDGEQKQWKDFLAKTGDKQIILYCRSGHRAGVVGAVLAGQGHKVANAGGFKDWQAAGQPVRRIEAAKP